MARRAPITKNTISTGVEVGIGAALLTALVARFVLNLSQAVAWESALIAGLVVFGLWLVRPLVRWVLGSPRSQRVPRWWAKRLTGAGSALIAGLAVAALARYGLEWSVEASLEIGVQVGLGWFAIWLLKPFFLWLIDVGAMIRLRLPRLPQLSRSRKPSLQWPGGKVSTDRLNEKTELQRISPKAFEELCAEIARSWGYKAKAVGESGDGGVDVEMWKDGELVIAQCKRYSNTVPITEIRDFYGTMTHFKAKRGYFFTTGKFSDGAYKFIEGKPIELLNGDDVAHIVEQRRITLPHAF